MANSAAVYARIDPQLKKEVETILKELQVSPSALIQMLYGQIKLTKGIPFEVKLPPENKPIFIEDLNIDELNRELEKGVNSINNRDVYSLEEVEAVFKKDNKDN